MLSPTTTFGVSCTGNVQALTMCLASVVNSRLIPHKIQVRMEGEFPSINNFYLEQMAEFARLSGIEFIISVGNANGVRSARDWHLDNCTSKWLWMGDDDVIYHPDCLQTLCRANLPGEVAYVQGVKSDLNNRRGYPDFFSGVHPREEIKDGCSFNHRYDQLPELRDLSPKTKISTVQVHTLDTGNVMLDVELAREKNFRFQLFPESYNSGGEDTLYALQVYQAGYTGRFCPFAVSYHLEKPNPAFNEFAARGEMLLRACDLLGYDKEKVISEFMPFLKLNRKVVNTNATEQQESSKEGGAHAECAHREEGSREQNRPEIGKAYLYVPGKEGSIQKSSEDPKR